MMDSSVLRWFVCILTLGHCLTSFPWVTNALAQGTESVPEAGTLWQPMATAGAPIGYRAQVWTGTELLVWGGPGGQSAVNEIARYDPRTDSWRTITTTGAPATRLNPTVVWTGTEMIVWGGLAGATRFGDGGRYNLATNTWTPLPPSVLAPRSAHSAVWTGSEMIIWGGNTADGRANDGARYDPTSDTWSRLPSVDLIGRADHGALWMGNAMLVWGGRGEREAVVSISDVLRGDGAIFYPATNSWAPVAMTGAPTPRREVQMVWTGSEVILWGGRGIENADARADGARYDPSRDAWIPLSSVGAPRPRYDYSMIWTGAELIVWGGLYAGGRTVETINDGARYLLSTDRWIPLLTPEVLPTRGRAAVWTGQEMLLGSTRFHPLWLQVQAPTPASSLADEPRWVAQSGEQYRVIAQDPGWVLAVGVSDTFDSAVWIADDDRIALTIGP